VFAGFSLPDVTSVARRTVILALVIGVLGLVGCLVMNVAFVGLGLCVGLGLGIVNFRLILRSVARVGEREDENRRRPLALNTMGRLSVISVLALGLLFVSFDLGLGIMVGLALFQGLLLVNVARSMFTMGHGGAGFGSVIDADVVVPGEAGELEPGPGAAGTGSPVDIGGGS
jgi:hypothetical protein